MNYVMSYLLLVRFPHNKASYLTHINFLGTTLNRWKLGGRLFSNILTRLMGTDRETKVK